MTQTSELAKEVLKDLIAIERTLWENNAEIYHDRYSPRGVTDLSWCWPHRP
jgi:hypothetical protein